MMDTVPARIRKRDGSLQAFDAGKIEQAVYKALAATGTDDRHLAAELAAGVVESLTARPEPVPSVEEVQDIVEEVLMTRGRVNAAKAYILYRQRRTSARCCR